MAVDDMTLANEALKDFLLDGLRNQINEEVVVLNQMEQNTTSVSGRDIVMALKYGRSGGVGNGSDTADMPKSNPRKRKQAKWETKNTFGHMEISDKTIKASRNSRGAFADLLESDLDDLKTDAVDSVSRQVFGDGSGTVAVITTGVTNTTFTCSGGVGNLSVGQWVDIFASGSTVGDTPKASAREVTAVDYDSDTFTISGANVTVANTDIVVISGSIGAELTGFGAVLTKDNTIYGINRANDKWFNPHVFALDGEISEVGIQARIDFVDKRAGGKTNLLISSDGVRRSYQNLLVATKQTIEVTKLRGGYSTLTYTSGNKVMPFMVDKYARAGELIGLDLNTWANYSMGDWDWLPGDSGGVLRVMTNKAQYEATLVKYHDLGCDKPAGNWRMTGITEHAG